MNYCYFGMSDDDSIVGFKRGSSYILEIYTLILFYFISKKKKKKNLEFASKLLGSMVVVIGEGVEKRD